MTPAEQDKELRELVHIVQNADTTYDAMQFITADRKRVALEARENISKLYEKELDMHRKFMDSVIANNQLKTTVMYCNKCGAELKAQQEQRRYYD